MNPSIEEKKKPFNIFQRFLLVAVIPTIFALIVLVLLLTYSGVDVLEKGKEWINQYSLFKTEQATKDEIIADNEENITMLEKKLSEQTAQIEGLEKQLESSENRIQAANLEKEKLQNEINTLKNAQDETKKKFEEIVKTYEAMSAKKSASVLSEMKESEAVKILAELKPAKLATILEKMEPSIASKYTELLAQSTTSNVENP